ncbi:P450-derived glycosyltransferase activator [Nocardiopsis mwathae]|uniref:P450-derived glycosyltransferase activator n=1 Tax=Nocardiopsis mwathae TaxID=1472723 RepID=A0A7X0D8N7_9ACTN|nr:P450-derived glycosyltransferase activator [Nocardiopsis mwathae]MBB6174214.1 P450-derived glycosyltransferase activator [Nocardiopsis mwathae]
MEKDRETTVIRRLLDHDVSDVTDSELGFHLGTTRALQWHFGSHGDTYALILRGQTDDPHPLYAAAREQGPLHFSMAGSWVTADADIAERVLNGTDFALADAAGRAAEPQVLPFFGSGRPLLERDDAERLRPQWEPHVGAEALAGHRTAIHAVYRGRAERCAAAVGFDLMGDFARPAAIAVTADLIGVPEGERERFADRCTGAAALPDSLLAAQRVETVRALDAALADLDLLLTRLSAPGGAESDTPVGAALPHPVRMLLSTLGVSAAADLIGNAVLALLDHPDQWDLLRTSPDLAASAVAETLRYDPPVHLETRVARHDVELAGERLPKGAHVAVLTAAVGRDPGRHPRPDRFDITRSHTAPQIAFPAGPHHEPVAALTLLQAESGLRALAEHLPGLRRTAPVVHPRRRPVTRGPLELPASAS